MKQRPAAARAHPLLGGRARLVRCALPLCLLLSCNKTERDWSRCAEGVACAPGFACTPDFRCAPKADGTVTAPPVAAPDAAPCADDSTCKSNNASRAAP